MDKEKLKLFLEQKNMETSRAKSTKNINPALNNNDPTHDTRNLDQFNSNRHNNQPNSGNKNRKFSRQGDHHQSDSHHEKEPSNYYGPNPNNQH